jgi:hypothetical protein
MLRTFVLRVKVSVCFENVGLLEVLGLKCGVSSNVDLKCAGFVVH